MCSALPLPPFCTFTHLLLSPNPPLCRQDRIPNSVSVSQSASKSGTAGQRRTSGRTDERPATAESTAEASSTWTCRLSPLPPPPPPTDDTKRRRQRSNELFLLPFFKAPRSVEPNSDLGLPLPLQETDSSARSQSHYCAMGTYHFAPPTRRHVLRAQEGSTNSEV